MTIESGKSTALLFRQGLGSGINKDAWGTQKTSFDHSLLSGVFTFELSNRQVKIFENDVEIIGNENSTGAISESGALVLRSGLNVGDIRRIESLRHPRYQANRGHHYGVSVILPTAQTESIVRFGLGTVDNRVYFEIESGVIYACIVSGGILRERQVVNIPFEIDLINGNIFDIQFQWRGVGDYFFYVGDKADASVKIVKHIKFLGMLDRLSIENPAMPYFFECVNVGGVQAELKCGCVDISSENGHRQVKQRVSVDTGDNIAVQGNDVVLVAAQVPNIFNGQINTRDFEVIQIVGSSDQRIIIRGYITRDSTAFNGTLPAPAQLIDSSLVYYLQPNPSAPSITFDSNKGRSIGSLRVPANDSKLLSIHTDEQTTTFVAAGDYIVVTATKVQQNAIAGANIILGEEV